MTPELDVLSRQVYDLQQQIFELRKTAAPQEIEDGELANADGRVLLSELFGDREHLFLIHNMGRSCSYCTLWADVVGSTVPILQQRGAVVLVSPDSPEDMAETARVRGWSMPMASDLTGELTERLGMKTAEGWWPGTSVFTKSADGKIYRTGRDIFGPGDAYCSVWHFFSMLPGGSGDWEPA